MVVTVQGMNLTPRSHTAVTEGGERMEFFCNADAWAHMAVSKHRSEACDHPSG
jgi:hypothetical protein